MSTVGIKFSATNALSLCHDIQQLEALPSPTAVETERLGISLRDLAEVLVWCDKHDEAACDRVLDCGIMTTVERIATNAMADVASKVHAVEFVTILLQNLSRLSSIYLVCSNNHLNRIIAMQVDTETDDDELLSVYTSFLKTLTLRLDAATLQFFFDGSTLSFPLFDKAIKLLMSRDAIIGAAARQVVVTIAQLREDSLSVYLCKTMPDVFDCVADLLERKLVGLGDSIPWTGKPPPHSAARAFNLRTMNGDVEDALDDVYYVNDLLAVTPQPVADAAVVFVANRLVLPMRRAVTRALALAPDTTAATEARLAFPSGIAVETILAFMARWLAACDAGTPLCHLIVDTFTCASEGVNSDGGVLACLLHSPQPHLYGNAVRLLHAVLQRSPLGFSAQLSATEKKSEGTAAATPIRNVDASLASAPPPSDVDLLPAAIEARVVAFVTDCLATVGVAHLGWARYAWVLPSLVSALCTLLQQPERGRVTAVALVIQELRLVMDRLVAFPDMDAALSSRGRDTYAHVWRSLLALSNASLRALTVTAGKSDIALCATNHDADAIEDFVTAAGNAVLTGNVHNWLGPPCTAAKPWEKVFLLLKREETRMGRSLAELVEDDALVSRHDAAWFIPALRHPSFAASVEVSPHWVAVREAVEPLITALDRLPVSLNEAAEWRGRVWLLVRAFTVHQMDAPEGAHATLHEKVVSADAFASHSAYTDVSAPQLQQLALADIVWPTAAQEQLAGQAPCPPPHGLHCELAGECYASATCVHVASPGTPMRFAWSDNETLYLLKAPTTVANGRGRAEACHTATLLFSMDVVYVETATLATMPFQVVIGYNPPVVEKAVEVYVTVRNQAVAKQLVVAIETVVKAHREEGAELVQHLCGSQ